jgi:C4-dicarboxylate transporter DctQ subunit
MSLPSHLEHPVAPLTSENAFSFDIEKSRQKGMIVKMKRIVSMYDGLIRFLDSLSGILIVLVMLLVCVHVFARYVLQTPMDWVVQFSQYSLLVLVFLGAAWLLKLEGHVNIDILLTRIKPKNKNLLILVTSTLGTIVCLIIFWYSGKTTLELIQKGTRVLDEVQVPQYAITSFIPLMFFLLLIQFIRRTRGVYRKWREAERPVKAATSPAPGQQS